MLRSRRFREIVFLAVGISTPVGILAVNASAFVMRHLTEFRVGLAVCALVSGLSLNGLFAWQTLLRGRRYAPLLYSEYRFWLVSVAIVYVLGWSAFGAYGTYYSMQDPKRLPDPTSVLIAVVLLLLPFAITILARRLNLVRMEQEEENKQGPPPRRGTAHPT
jgi:hypothetical protein